MSMTNSEVGSRHADAPWYWSNRSRISWGAVLAGAVVAVASTILLNLLGAAMGAGSIHALDGASPANLGLGAAIWEIINLLLSMAFGGYVASRLSGTHSHLDGELHGLTMWGLAVLLGSVLLAHAFSGLLGIMGQGTNSIVNRTVGEAGTALGALPAEANPQVMADRLQQSLSNNGDPTTMSREQINAEISGLVRKSLNSNLSQADRNRLVALVAAQSGVTGDEAARRVTQMENDARVSVTQAEQEKRSAADEVAHNAATAARALFSALTLGLLGALVGSWIGTRHKRALHPVHEYAGPTQPSPAHAAYERYEPVSVSVYDDADRLVSQYLRGVSFPVNKQDLLRLARSSGNAAPGLLHSIEGMPERSYANANEVLSALGAVH
jgi:hypothetical protein